MLHFDFLHEYLYWGYVLYLFGILGTNARSLGPFLDLLIHIIESRRSLKFPWCVAVTAEGGGWKETRVQGPRVRDAGRTHHK